jgi:hypothetical protein
MNSAVPLLVAVSPRDPNVCGVLCCFCRAFGDDFTKLCEVLHWFYWAFGDDFAGFPAELGEDDLLSATCQSSGRRQQPVSYPRDKPLRSLRTGKVSGGPL